MIDPYGIRIKYKTCYMYALWKPSEQPFINCSRYFRAPHWKSMGLPEIHQRTQNAIITLLWRRNDVPTSFWRHNDVIIASCVHWVEGNLTGVAVRALLCFAVVRYLYLPCPPSYYACHDDIMTWKQFPHYWPFVRGIHRSAVDSPHKESVCGTLAFSFMLAWTSWWTKSGIFGDLRRCSAHVTSLSLHWDYDNHAIVPCSVSEATLKYKCKFITWLTAYGYETATKLSTRKQYAYFFKHAVFIITGSIPQCTNVNLV